MYGLSGFTENLNSVDMLNVQNRVNPMGNYVHQMYRLAGFAKNLNIQNCVNLSGGCGQYIYRLLGFTKNMNSEDMLNVQNCVNPNGNCVHWMFGLLRFAENFYIRNCINSVGNCIHQVYGFAKNLNSTNCLDFIKKSECCKYVVCIELCKSNRKFCTLNVRIVQICRKFEFCNYVERIELCKQTYGLFGFAKIEYP